MVTRRLPRPHACPCCGAGFATPASLRAHLQVAHEGECPGEEFERVCGLERSEARAERRRQGAATSSGHGQAFEQVRPGERLMSPPHVVEIADQRIPSARHMATREEGGWFLRTLAADGWRTVGYVSDGLFELASPATVMSAQVVLDFLRVALDERPGPPARGRLVSVQAWVAAHYGFEREQLLRQDRTASVCVARRVAMLACRRLLGMSYPEIGRAFLRDHTTALHGCKVAEEHLHIDEGARELLVRIDERLREGPREAAT